MYAIPQEARDLFRNSYRQVLEIKMTGTQTTIPITDEDVVAGGMSVNRYCLSGNRIEVGSAIAAELTLKLDNATGKFDDVVFEGAELFVRVGVKKWDAKRWENANLYYVPIGYFTVDEVPRKLASISLTALDRMVLFDKSVDSSLLAFPTTVDALLSRICDICNVPIGINIAELLNHDYEITALPQSDNLTYRQILSWIAEITGTCAFIDWDGRLVLSWYNMTDTVIEACDRFTSDLQENSITISGVQVVDGDTVYLAGDDGYAMYTAKKLIEIAIAELGYCEKESNSQLDDKTANAGSNNWTKYARDLHNAGYYQANKNGYAWCDMFVDWCFYKLAGGKTKGEYLECQTGLYGAGCGWSAQCYRNAGRFDKTPKPSDQIFFGKSGSEEHTGIVEKVDGSKVYTIEGNSSNKVQRCSYALTNSRIVGYGHPRFDAEDETVNDTAAEMPSSEIDVGAVVKITGAKYYGGQTIPAWVKAKNWVVHSLSGDRVVINKSEDGKQSIMSPVNIKDLSLVSGGSEKWVPAVGDTVNYNGTTHYVSANATNASKCKGGKAKITAIYQLGKSKHPYHLIRVSGSGATVYGWVDENTFTKA